MNSRPNASTSRLPRLQRHGCYGSGRTWKRSRETDSPEAYQKRRELVMLLVAGIMAGKHDDGSPDVRITYRFGPPEPYPEEDVFASGIEKAPAQLALKHSSNWSGETSRTPPIWNAPAL